MSGLIRPISPVPASNCRRYAFQSSITVELLHFLRRSLTARYRSDIFGGTRHVTGVFDPPAAEGLVQIHEIGKARQARRHQRQLGAVQTSLRRKHAEVIVDA